MQAQHRTDPGDSETALRHFCVCAVVLSPGSTALGPLVSACPSPLVKFDSPLLVPIIPPTKTPRFLFCEVSPDHLEWPGAGHSTGEQ